jgi:hypothetical protein
MELGRQQLRHGINHHYIIIGVQAICAETANAFTGFQHPEIIATHIIIPGQTTSLCGFPLGLLWQYERHNGTLSRTGTDCMCNVPRSKSKFIIPGG